MPQHRTERRESRRGFRPTLDGKLEPRVLMAQLSAIHARTAAGGQAVVITNTSGAEFYVSTFNGGTVRALPASGGRVNLIVDGSTPSTLLEINSIVPAQIHGTAHTFHTYLSTPNNKLNIASLNVTSGMISAIEGYQTANLSGSIVVAGPARVDRIALNSILPGGSIQTGGDLNTLDVFHDVTLSGGNISIGRDLNWFETYGNVTLSNNSNFLIGRDAGGIPQPAKGSGNQGQGINISGNLTIDPGSVLAIGRNLPPLNLNLSPGAGLVVSGNATGLSRVFIGGVSLQQRFPSNIGILGTLSA